jgi:hypothetical protein
MNIFYLIYVAISYTVSADESYEKLKVPGSGPIHGREIRRALAA